MKLHSPGFEATAFSTSNHKPTTELSFHKCDSFLRFRQAVREHRYHQMSSFAHVLLSMTSFAHTLLSGMRAWARLAFVHSPLKLRGVCGDNHADNPPSAALQLRSAKLAWGRGLDIICCEAASVWPPTVHVVHMPRPSCLAHHE